MFDQVKRLLRELREGGTTPASLSLMKEALVEAKLAVAESRKARDAAAATLVHERSELETVRRRGQLAAQINDLETVAVAARFEQKHAERIAILERKLGALEEEVSLGERELDEMHTQFAALAKGSGAPPKAPRPGEAAGVDELESAHNALRREAEQVARAADADRRLEELKKKMGSNG